MRSAFNPALFVAGVLGASSAARALRADCPELLVPAYQYPTLGAMWSTLAATSPGTLVTVIVNPASGPGTLTDPNYVAAIAGVRSGGGRIVGYVDTGYATRPSTAVLADVQQFLALYGPLDGVFLDQMDNTPTSLAYYQQLTASIHALLGTGRVFANPGTSVPESFVRDGAADVIVTYENNLTGAEPYPTLATPDWVYRYPASRFAHIVYNIPDVALAAATIHLARDRNVGFVSIWSGILPNPYGELPPYWSDEAAAFPRQLCHADVNCSGTLDPDDLGDFITCYFQQVTLTSPCPTADFNADSVTDPDDLGDYITLYFAGCD